MRRLLERGYVVRVLDAGFFGHESLRDVLGRIELIEGDVRTSSPDVCKGVDTIVHLAGFSNDPTAEFNPQENFSVNVAGTQHMVELAKQTGVKRFVFASSCSVYYSTNIDDEEKNERAHIAPTVPYSLSKLQAESVVWNARGTGFSPVILRKGTVGGLSPRMRYDLVVNALVKDAYTRGEMMLHMGGRMYRPLLDIEDAARAYIFALEHPKMEGVYNTVGDNVLIRDLALDIQRILKIERGKDIYIEQQEVGTRRSYRVSNAKHQDAGFRPTRRLQETVLELWDDLAKGTRNVQDDKYYNIRVFEKRYESAK